MKRLLLLAVLLCTPLTARADAPSDKADIARIENYMNTLTTAKARFTQVDPQGVRETGTFYLSRPGRVRFEYDDPIDDFIVADGLFIYFYDGELKEQTNAPIGQTLADFILRDKIKLSGDVKVLDIIHGENTLNVQVTQTADPAAGSITLTFTENPFTLQQWKVKDAQGLTTTIALSGIATGVKLPYEIFVYADPKTGKIYNR
jgi:outer membrane lipoprotein-sorting protein